MVKLLVSHGGSNPGPPDYEPSTFPLDQSANINLYCNKVLQNVSTHLRSIHNEHWIVTFYETYFLSHVGNWLLFLSTESMNAFQMTNLSAPEIYRVEQWYHLLYRHVDVTLSSYTDRGCRYSRHLLVLHMSPIPKPPIATTFQHVGIGSKGCRYRKQGVSV